MSVVPDAAIQLIKQFEGFRAEAYPDPISHWAVPTIGYGLTLYPDGSRVRQGDTLSEAGACACLAHHLAKTCAPALRKIPTWGQMNTHQQSALFSFAYNLGSGFYQAANFKAITTVCDSPTLWGDANWIAEQFGKYTNHNFVGLVRRRQAEAKLFCQPV